MDDDPGWGPSRALVAFREPVVGAFARTPDTTDVGADVADEDVHLDEETRAALRELGYLR